MTLRADDRVLLLEIPPDCDLIAMARILSHGVLVALGERDAVDRARATLAEFDNTMIIEADARQIPWREAFFTLIVVPEHMRELARAAQREVVRVLAPGGRIDGWTADA